MIVRFMEKNRDQLIKETQEQLEERFVEIDNRHRKIRKNIMMISLLSFFFFTGQGIMLDTIGLASGTQLNDQEGTFKIFMIMAAAEMFPLLLILGGFLFWYTGPIKDLYDRKYAGEEIPEDLWEKGTRRARRFFNIHSVLTFSLYLIFSFFGFHTEGKPAMTLILEMAPKLTLGMGMVLFSSTILDLQVFRPLRKTFGMVKFEGPVPLTWSVNTRIIIAPLVFLLNGVFILIDAVLKLLTGAASRFDINRERIEQLFNMGTGGDTQPPPAGAAPDLSSLSLPDMAVIQSGLGLLVALIIIPALAVFIAMALSQRFKLKDLDEKVTELAEGSGDLTKKILVQSEDELALITTHLNDFIESLRQKLLILSQSAGKVMNSTNTMHAHLENTSAATEEMVASVNQINRTTVNRTDTISRTGDELLSLVESLDRVSASVDNQAAFVDQTSSAINEMAASISSVSQSTRKASELSVHLKDAARDGEKAVTDSIGAVRAVETSSEEVNSLVTLITETSETTNLLAMNAAIEAAHAGDAGKGFAVVADEVRRLAVDSSDGARQITGQVQSMVDTVGKGVKLSEEAGESLGRVLRDIEETSRVMEGIALAMDEQNAGTTEILKSITSLVDATSVIKEVTAEQRAKNESMRTSVDMIVQAFNEIKMATDEQAQGTQEIVDLITALQDVAGENQEVVETLEKAFSGFKLS